MHTHFLDVSVSLSLAHTHTNLISWGCRIRRIRPGGRVRPLLMNVLDMIQNNIMGRSSSNELGNMTYIFIVTTVQTVIVRLGFWGQPGLFYDLLFLKTFNYIHNQTNSYICNHLTLCK